MLRNVQNQWRGQPVPPPPASRQSADAYDYCQSNLSFLLWRFGPATTYGETSHWVGLSGRVMGPKQRPLPDDTQHSGKTNIHAPGGGMDVCLSIPASKRPQAHALDPAATGIDSELTLWRRNFLLNFSTSCT